MQLPDRPKVVYDIECYRNFFCVCFKSIESGKTKTFVMYEGSHFDREGIKRIIRNNTLVSFNGNNYDVNLLLYSLKPSTQNIDLKNLSDNIIVYGLKPWQVRDRFPVPDVPDWFDHIDLIEVAPGMASLKIYGGRLGSRRMQDLPIDPDAHITQMDAKRLTDYCINDLDTTIDLFKDLSGELNLRYAMTEQYDIDCRSKSDAQIAEAIIISEIQKRTSDKIYRPDYPYDYTWKYDAPDYLSFRTPQMRELFDRITSTVFRFTDKGGIGLPDFLKDFKIPLGNSKYTLGIGGLHSNEKKAVHISDHLNTVFDFDVASYYPSIILNCQLAPEQLGMDFFDIYSGFKAKRLEAKAKKDKVMDSGLKIFLNGSFGKFGSPYSKLYAPKLMTQVTVTGQLALLKLIETLELNAIPVVSANTDGVVIKCPNQSQNEMREIIRTWESETGFVMEEAVYAAIYSRDVNNYIAVKRDGSVKQKGAYAFTGSKGKAIEKNPQNHVSIDAVLAHLTKGASIEDFIRNATDFKRFVTVRKVDGGAIWNGTYLGKAIRWYYAKGQTGHIEYKRNGNKVPQSDGAKPAMVLPDGMPSDIDYDRYVAEANDIMKEIGCKQLPKFWTNAEARLALTEQMVTPKKRTRKVVA